MNASTSTPASTYTFEEVAPGTSVIIDVHGVAIAVTVTDVVRGTRGQTLRYEVALVTNRTERTFAWVQPGQHVAAYESHGDALAAARSIRHTGEGLGWI